MREIGPASVNQVIQAYEGDSKVLELTSQWPNLPFMRLVLVRIAQRPVDQILQLAWKLYELDKDDFLKKVYAVWCDPPHCIFTWTFGEMLDRLDATTWRPDPEKWKNVQVQIPDWKKTPLPELTPVMGYYQGPGTIHPGCINLEDGHTRLTAAHLAGSFPRVIRMYIGEPPVRA